MNPEPSLLPAIRASSLVCASRLPRKLAIARAFQAASLRGVPLIAITAWDYGPYDAFNAEIWAHSMDEMNQMMVDEAEKLIADKVANIRADWMVDESANVEAEVRMGIREVPGGYTTSPSSEAILVRTAESGL